MQSPSPGKSAGQSGRRRALVKAPVSGLALLLVVAAAGASTSPALAQDDEAGEAPALPQVAAGQVPAGSVGGMGDVNIYPRRVVLNGRERIASVGMYNRMAAPGEYEISIVDMVMTPDGGIHPLDNLPPGVSAERLQSASAMLRWSPRRVSLPGSEAQTVRIMARPPEGLPDGEYRAHFMAVSIPPDADQGFSVEQAVGGAAGTADGIGVTIRPRFGISIPVILRVGETTLQAGLTDLALTQTPDGPAITLTITRSGTRSAYGDIVVTMAGSAEPVALSRGIGVYPEVDSRQVRIGLNPQFDRALLRPGSVLSVTYTDDDFAPGQVLARQDFTVR